MLRQGRGGQPTGGRFQGRGYAESNSSYARAARTSDIEKMPWLSIASNLNDNVIAISAPDFDDWVKEWKTRITKEQGGDFANGISISETEDYIMPIRPPRPEVVIPDDLNDAGSVAEAKFENELNSKEYFMKIGRNADRAQLMEDAKTKVHATILLNCSETVKTRLKKTPPGVEAEKGRCPKALITALQVALCTNNRNDPLEKVDAARHALAAMYHCAGEPLMTLKKKVLASLRAVVSAVTYLHAEQCNLMGLDPDPDDDPDEVDRKEVARNQIGLNLHTQYVPTEEVLTRELLSTLDRNIWGGYRESVKRQQSPTPTTMNELVESAAQYGPGPATGNILVDTPGRGAAKERTREWPSRNTSVRVAVDNEYVSEWKEMRTCHACGKQGHISNACTAVSNYGGRGQNGGRGGRGQGRGQTQSQTQRSYNKELRDTTDKAMVNKAGNDMKMQKGTAINAKDSTGSNAAAGGGKRSN
jgi:hypothetical protein